MRFRMTFLTCSVILCVLLAGCSVPAVVSGGGSMPSTFGNGNLKATFTFSGDSCSDITGALNYVDKADKAHFGEDVKFNGMVMTAGLCTAEIDELSSDLPGCSFAGNFRYPPHFGCLPGWYQIEFEYLSTNPRMPGEGSGVACLMEGSGTGKNKGHFAYLYLFDGPFDDYDNGGFLQGNVSMSACPE